MTIIEQIGRGNLLNSILVNENVRPAMLIQPADYNEATGKDPKTKSIVEAIKQQFPKLLSSEDYQTYQGVILSKSDYNGQEISLERMGEILGYPCYQDFNQTHPEEEVAYSISVYAKQANGPNITLFNGPNITLFANVCKDQSALEQFKRFAEEAKLALDKEEYKGQLEGMAIDNVDVEITETIPVQVLIARIIENKKLEQSELDKIQNILFNLGFSPELQLYFMDHFQYTNPIHKGILLDLIVRFKNNPLLAFAPLQDYPKQDKEVGEITQALEKDLLDLLEKTKQSTVDANSGNKMSRRRRKKLASKRKTMSIKGLGSS